MKKLKGTTGGLEVSIQSVIPAAREKQGGSEDERHVCDSFNKKGNKQASMILQHPFMFPVEMDIGTSAATSHR